MNKTPLAILLTIVFAGVGVGYALLGGESADAGPDLSDQEARGSLSDGFGGPIENPLVGEAFCQDGSEILLVNSTPACDELPAPITDEGNATENVTQGDGVAHCAGATLAPGGLVCTAFNTINSTLQCDPFFEGGAPPGNCPNLGGLPPVGVPGPVQDQLNATENITQGDGVSHCAGAVVTDGDVVCFLFNTVNSTLECDPFFEGGAPPGNCPNLGGLPPDGVPGPVQDQLNATENITQGDGVSHCAGAVLTDGDVVCFLFNTVNSTLQCDPFLGGAPGNCPNTGILPPVEVPPAVASTLDVDLDTVTVHISGYDFATDADGKVISEIPEEDVTYNQGKLMIWNNIGWFNGNENFTIPPGGATDVTACPVQIAGPPQDSGPYAFVQSEAYVDSTTGIASYSFKLSDCAATYGPDSGVSRYNGTGPLPSIYLSADNGGGGNPVTFFTTYNPAGAPWNVASSAPCGPAGDGCPVPPVNPDDEQDALDEILAGQGTAACDPAADGPYNETTVCTAYMQVPSGVRGTAEGALQDPVGTVNGVVDTVDPDERDYCYGVPGTLSVCDGWGEHTGGMSTVQILLDFLGLDDTVPYDGLWIEVMGENYPI